MDALLRRKGSSLSQAIREMQEMRPIVEQEIRAAAGGAPLTDDEVTRSVNARIADRIGNLLTQQDMERVVDKALEMTFAEKPKFDSFGYHMVRMINKAPFVLTGVIPFPRFMWQASKFYLEFRPAGFIRSGAYGARPELLSRAIIGSL